MRIQRTEHGTTLWASARDTWDWANRPGSSWPCSELADHRIRVELDSRGNLVDFAVDGRDGDVNGTELNAFLEDALGAPGLAPR